MNIDRLFNKLKDNQKAYALEALMHPHTRDAFEYGYRSGIIAGYEAAINVLLTLLKEEKDNDSDL